MKLLAVSVGCPSGIGPEVAVVAASRAKARTLLVGDAGVVARAAEARGIARARIVRVEQPAQARALKAGAIPLWQPTAPLAAKDARAGAPSRAGGAVQLAWIDAACDLVTAGEAAALVTGPVSKEAIARSGAPGGQGFLGHTEHLQRRLRAREVVMAFWTEAFTTSLATTHLALADVPRAVTPAAVARAAYWLARFLWELQGARAKPLAVAALNPHAGEGGLLGREEETRIAPGIERARARLAKDGVGLELHGPVPAESAFRRAARGDFGGVAAMYHDQATIAMKLVGFGEAVNVSLGLPIVRTSVDHGTAYDRAARFDADARGMEEAIALAARLVRRPRAPRRPAT